MTCVCGCGDNVVKEAFVWVGGNMAKEVII